MYFVGVPRVNNVSFGTLKALNSVEFFIFLLLPPPPFRFSLMLKGIRKLESVATSKINLLNSKVVKSSGQLKVPHDKRRHVAWPSMKILLRGLQ